MKRHSPYNSQALPESSDLLLLCVIQSARLVGYMAFAAVLPLLRRQTSDLHITRVSMESLLSFCSR